jgi:hypothetical protein
MPSAAVQLGRSTPRADVASDTWSGSGLARPVGALIADQGDAGDPALDVARGCRPPSWLYLPNAPDQLPS